MPFLNKTQCNFNSKKAVQSALKQGYIPFSQGKYLYDGNWLNDKRQGFGIDARKERNIFVPVYKGNHSEGKRDGMGNYYYKNGSFYTGQWKKGHRWGFGKMWYSDGSFYGGYWKCNKRHGEGLFVDVKGNRYEGNWMFDEKHGLGRFYHLVTGQMQEGAWFKNAAICTTIEDIPFRKTVISPSKYPIRKNELQDSDTLIYENYLNLYKENSELIVPLQKVESASDSSSIYKEKEISSYVEIY